MKRLILLFTILTLTIPVLAQKTPRTPSDSNRTRDIRIPDTTRTLRPSWSPLLWKSVSRTHLSRDSMILIPYSRLSDVAVWIPGGSSFGLGMFLQPMEPRRLGSFSQQTGIIQHGLRERDSWSGATSDLNLSLETATDLVAHAPWLSFWHAGSGSLAAFEIEDSLIDAPRPMTKIRHVESAYEYLWTDVLFALNPGPASGVQFGLTRQTVGFSNSYNQARFINERAESWNLRFTAASRVSRFLETTLRSQWTDHTQLMHGGIASTDSRNHQFLYPSSSTAFADTAFSPILASTINPGWKQESRRFQIHSTTRLHWDEAEHHVSDITVGYRRSGRDISDGLGIPPFDSTGRGPLSRSESWSEPMISFMQKTTLSPVHLVLDASLSSFTSDTGIPGQSLTETRSTLRAAACTDLGPLRVEAYSRLDREGTQTAPGLGIGASGALPYGFEAWVGGSWSRRPYSRAEIQPNLPAERVLILGHPGSDLPTVTIMEGGLRKIGEHGHLEARLFSRHVETPRILSMGHESGPLPLRTLAIVSDQGLTEDLNGATLSGTFVWNFLQADGHATLSSTRLSGNPTIGRLIPDFQSTISLACRFSLIAGTLDLKTGVSHQYCSTFTPVAYLPEMGIFVYPSMSVGNDQYVDEYTSGHVVDFFLFATIKKSATIHLHFYNVLDTRFITTAFYPMFERGVRFGVDWILWD